MGIKDPATKNSTPEKQKYENVKNYISDLAKGTDSVTGSVESSTHSVEEMQKYIADLKTLTGAQEGTDEDAAAEDSSDPHKVRTPKKKGDASEPDARHEMLGEIVNSKNNDGDQETKQVGTWA